MHRFTGIAILAAVAVSLAAPPVPLIKYPSGQTTTRFRANWNLVTGATGYRLDVSTDPLFTTFTGVYNNYDCGNRDTTRVTGLTLLTRYYYRVRAYDGSGSSGSSNVRSAFTRPYTSWNGSAWSNSNPAAARPAVIDSFLTMTASYTTGRLYVNPGAVLTIDTIRWFRVDTLVHVEGSIIIASKGTKSGALTGSPTIAGRPLFEMAGGTIQIQRLVSANRWHMMSVPLSGATAALFTGAYLRSYNETTNTFNSNITSAATPLPLGTGYGMWTNTDRMITFPGTPNTASVTPAIAFSGTAYGYNLLGNPFSAPLDWQSSAWTRTNISNTMWQWVHGAGNYGTRTTGGGTTNGVGRYIPVGQGFFVKATAAGAVVTMPFNARIVNATSAGQAFYKALDDSTDTLAPPEIPQVNMLSLTATGDSSYQDEIALRFDALAGESYDPERDAPKLIGDIVAPQLYAVLGDGIYSMKSLPWPVSELRVPIAFRAGTASRSYTITCRGDLAAILVDLKTASRTAMGDGLVYAFTADSADALDRFELLFDASAAGSSRASVSAAAIGVTLHGTVMEIRSPELVNSLVIYDLQGRELLRQIGPFPRSLAVTVAPGSYIADLFTMRGTCRQALLVK